MAPPPNFVVSDSITIKFGVLIEFDKFLQISQKIQKLMSLPSSDVIFCFRLPYSLKFFISGQIWLKFGSEDKFQVLIVIF